MQLENTQGSMFQVSDKVPPYIKRNMPQSNYDEDYAYDNYSDEIEPNTYIPPSHVPLHRPHRLDNFEYDEEISVSNGGLSYEEEEDQSIIH